MRTITKKIAIGTTEYLRLLAAVEFVEKKKDETESFRLRDYKKEWLELNDALDKFIKALHLLEMEEVEKMVEEHDRIAIGPRVEYRVEWDRDTWELIQRAKMVQR